MTQAYSLERCGNFKKRIVAEPNAVPLFTTSSTSTTNTSLVTTTQMLFVVVTHIDYDVTKEATTVVRVIQQ